MELPHREQAAIEIDPMHVKAHWRAAKACLYLGQTDQARSFYSQAQKLADSPADKDAIAAESRECAADQLVSSLNDFSATSGDGATDVVLSSVRHC